MPTPSTSPITVQGHGANPPDNLSRIRDHSIPQHVPASLHEDIITTAIDYAGHPLVALAKQVLHDGRLAAERGLDVARTTLADETETLYRRHQLAHERTHASTKPALAKFDAAIGKLTDKVEALDDLLLGPKLATTPVQAVLIAEARRALSAMDYAARHKAIMHGIEVDDQITCMACTRTAPYLLGVNATDNEVEGYATAWAKRHHPDVVRQRDMLKEVLAHLQRGGQLLLSFTVSLSSTQIAAEARRLSARAADSIKAAGIDA